MNDYSLEILAAVRGDVESAHPGCTVTTSAITSEDASLPALWLAFTFPGEYAADSSGEAWTGTVVDAQAYSGTSEREARAIISTVDSCLRRMGFRRSNYTQVPNADPSVRRIAAKWRARVDRDGNVAAW